MATQEPIHEGREKLLSDLKLIIKDAEDLLRNTGAQMDSGYQTARAKFESTLQHAKSGLSTAQNRMIASGRDAAETADRYVQANPWQAIAIGAAIGLAAGLWIGRR